MTKQIIKEKDIILTNAKHKIFACVKPLYNTSLNKCRAWYIDGATNKKIHTISINQMGRVKIWAQSDY